MANYETTVQIPPLNIGDTGIHTITIESLKIKKVNGNSVFNPSDPSTFFKLPWTITSHNLPSGWSLGSIVQNAGPNNIHYQLPLNYTGNPSYETPRTGYILLTQTESNNTLRINLNQVPANPLVRLGLESNPNQYQQLYFFNKAQNVQNVIPIWNHLNQYVYWNKSNNNLEVHGNFQLIGLGEVNKIIFSDVNEYHQFVEPDSVVKSLSFGEVSIYYNNTLKLRINNVYGYNFIFNFEPKVGGVFTSIYTADAYNPNYNVGISNGKYLFNPLNICFKVKNQELQYRRALEIKIGNTWYSYEQLVNISLGPEISVENDWICIPYSTLNPQDEYSKPSSRINFRINIQESNDFNDFEAYLGGYYNSNGQKVIQGIYSNMRQKIETDILNIDPVSLPTSQLLPGNLTSQLVYKITEGNNGITTGANINLNYFAFSSTQEYRAPLFKFTT